MTLPKKGLKTRPYDIGMNKRDLKKLTKAQLIKLLLKQEKKKPKVVIVDDTKPTRSNRRRKQKVVDDRPGWVRNPNTNRWIKIDGPTYRRLYPMQYALNRANSLHQEINETSKSIDDKYKSIMPSLDDVKPRTKIEQTDKALKGYTKSYEINIINNKDRLMQLQNTRKAVAYHITSVLKSMKGLKYVETLRVTFTKISDSEIVYKTAYFNSPPQTIINDLEIAKSLQVSKQNILDKIAKWISEGSGWTVESVDNHYLNVVKYQPIRGSSYINLPTELRNSSN